MNTPKEFMYSTSRSIINETALKQEGFLYIDEVYIAMTLYAKESINTLIKEFYKHNFDNVKDGGKLMSLGEFSIAFIKDNL